MIVNKHPTVLASHEFFVHNFINIILIVMSFLFFLTQSEELVTHRFTMDPTTSIISLLFLLTTGLMNQSIKLITEA